MKTKLRLLKTHYLNGTKHRKDHVVKVNNGAARILIEKGIAKIEKKQTPA